MKYTFDYYDQTDSFYKLRDNIEVSEEELNQAIRVYDIKPRVPYELEKRLEE